MLQRSQLYTVNGIKLHTMEAGPAQGNIIILLHGFPEFWYGWRKQVDFFSQKGWRVIAPDQRGYNLSSKPEGVEHYTIDLLTQDIVELIAQTGQDKVVVAGHDWGGGVAWNLALHYPHLLKKLVILNMPHPKVMHEHLTHNPKQMMRSWYTGFFQLPWLPERVNSSFDFKLLEKSITGSALPGTFTTEEMEHYKTAWAQPGALQGMINWYRAYKYQPIDAEKKIDTPTLMLWGKQDPFLGMELTQPSIDQCTNGQLIYLNEATHWLHHEQPDKVNTSMLAFLEA